MMKPFVTSDTIKRLSRRWLRDVAPYNHTEMKLTSDKAALLVIDMQRFFLEPDAPGFTSGAPAILPGVQRLIEEKELDDMEDESENKLDFGMNDEEMDFDLVDERIDTLGDDNEYDE